MTTEIMTKMMSTIAMLDGNNRDDNGNGD